ncbi:hypothetical protein DFJ73DRAFT_861985 [Zopfochytrium polystomum]|nr:hypothetical protein DFJ73DRAFT_861985 [Zopfochytrium polystomum]
MLRLARSPALNAPRAFIQRSPSAVLRPASALIQDRHYATERKPAAETAAALVNAFPGDNLAAKASSVLLFSSIGAWLISKEIYIVDGEFFEAIGLFGAYYIWYSAGKEGAVEWFNERQGTIRRVLNEAREQHKAVVQERIAHIAKLEDVVGVTKGLFEISKEIAKLEAQTYELKQKVSFANEIKSVLDSWVRHEANVRERQQKSMAEAIIAKVKADLANPKTQNDILGQTLVDIEKLAATAK